MRCVVQTIMAAPTNGRTAGQMWAENPDWMPGNCLQAAVASLLDLPLDAVPHFVACRDPGESWWRDLRRFMRGRGDDIFYVPVDDPGAAEWLAQLRERMRTGGVAPYVLASGKSPRGDFQHAVVWNLLDGRLAHDPHPSGDGLVSVEEYKIICAPYEPDPDQQYEEGRRAAG